MQKISVLILAFCVVFLIIGLLPVSGEGAIYDSVLRLHVIANSDEDYDQELKLKVRDAVLLSGEAIFSGSEDIISAEGKIAEKTYVLKAAAEETIENLGYNYSVKIELARSYFPTRIYDELTLPAGYYKAVRIVIGEGKGKNWWCIMFPPLCLPAATDNKEVISEYLNEKEMAVVSANPKYEVRFWLVEKYYDIKNRFFVED